MEVGVELKTKQLVRPYDVYNETVSYYKIIIPQEKPKQTVEEYERQGLEKYSHELKQETLEKFISNSNTPDGLDQFSYDKGLEAGAKWQAENMPIHVLDVENTYVHIEDGVIIVEKNDKSKKTYSEEEVLKLFHDYRIHFDLYRNIQVLPTMFSEWFEQFKKK